MSKAMLGFLIVFIILCLIVGWKFNALGPEQLLYLGKLVAGWLAWVVGVAIVYAGIEKLFPRILTPPLSEDPSQPK